MIRLYKEDAHMYINELDKRHRTGGKRFLEYWRIITEDRKTIGIIDVEDDNTRYTLEYNETIEGDDFISLVDCGITLYFPLMTISNDEKINFDDDILETNLLKLFGLLNNKKNFKLV